MCKGSDQNLPYRQNFWETPCRLRRDPLTRSLQSFRVFWGKFGEFSSLI